jgi:hypothetical protein
MELIIIICTVIVALATAFTLYYRVIKRRPIVLFENSHLHVSNPGKKAICIRYVHYSGGPGEDYDEAKMPDGTWKDTASTYYIVLFAGESCVLSGRLDDEWNYNPRIEKVSFFQNYNFDIYVKVTHKVNP